MPHIFSVEIHEYLSRKISQAEERKTEAIQKKDEALKSFCEGQLLELKTILRVMTK